MSHDGHDMRQFGAWTVCNAETRRDFEIIVETANEIFGEGSHWVEERAIGRAASARSVASSGDFLQGEAADNPYARQLSAGFRLLRFPAVLEREYIRHSQEGQRRSTLVCAWFALAVWLIFAYADIGRIADMAPSPDRGNHMWGVLIARATTTLLIVGGIWAVLRGVRVPIGMHGLAAAVLVPMGMATTVTTVIYKLEGLPQADLALMLIIIAAFFPVGLSFRQSLLVASVIALFGAAFGLVMLPPAQQPEQLRFAGILLLTVVFASVSGYLRELSHREQFLLRGLLAHQAYLDPLTGIHNRRWLDAHMHIARLQAAHHGASLAFVIVDIDHFKAYNDSRGHQEGDRALIAVARALAGFARRPLDVASRLGGDEFGLMLYDCSLEEARTRAEMLRAQLEDAGLADEVGQPGQASEARLTVSIGVVEIAPDEQAGDFYRRADRLLYASKKAGRNRVSG